LRKNSGDRKDLGVYDFYEVKGSNLDGLINVAVRKGIILYKIKKFGRKRLRVGVNFGQSENFFAIAEELCYNIKKVGGGGALYPLKKLLASFGLIIGAIIFVFTSMIGGDLLLSVSFTGSGKVYKREVNEYLLGVGVKKYSRFSEIDLKSLEDGILADNPHLSFAGCSRRGNVLIVDLALSKDGVDRLKGDEYSLVSDVSGVVESVKVYRGTAVVSVGDSVNKGDLLVDGYVTIKEQTLKTNVLACVSIIVEQSGEYRSKNDNEEDRALTFALIDAPDVEVLHQDVQKTVEQGEYLYKTTIKYRRILYAG